MSAEKEFISPELIMSDKDLTERIQSLENEIDALTFELSRLESELFYRKTPECRPVERQIK